MAYVLCAIMMYSFWWNKPFDSEHVYVVAVPNVDRNDQSDETPQDIDCHRKIRVRNSWKRYHQLDSNMVIDIIAPNDEWDLAGDAPITLIFYIVATAVSAIHLAAWNWDFQYRATKLIWRIFAVGAITSSLIAIYGGYIATSLTTPRADAIVDLLEEIFAYIYLICGVIYLICRTGLLVLIFYLFSQMPAEVYEATPWTDYLPHFS
jgi:hypothetical protein